MVKNNFWYSLELLFIVLNLFLFIIYIMSSDFAKKLVYDDRLMVSDSIDYAVIKGGSQVTQATFGAISQSTSSVTFNVQVPSEQTIIDRRVLWKSTFIVRVAGTPTINTYLLRYGYDTALGPFPLHNLCSVMSATINNNTVSTNIQDVLPSLLRMNDQRELMAYNSTTATQFDNYQVYSDGIAAANNPLGSYINSSDNDLMGRGSLAVTFLPAAGPAGVPADSTGNVRATGAAPNVVVYLQFTVTEPLLISPFIWANPQHNNQGIYGVQNLNFQFNLTGNPNRAFRSANLAAQNITSTTLYSISGNELLFTFITPPPSLLMPARNVVPYYETPRYITAFPTLPQGSQEMILNTLQLNQIPDKLIITARKRMGACTLKDPDYFLPITKITINWNNSSGILSSATPYDLYRYARDSGSNQTWNEFSGTAFKETAPVAADATPNVGVAVKTSGSMICLDFGKAIQISDDWYASGSLGNFNLQVTLTVNNNTGAQLDAEACLITLNSGVFVCERGSSSTYTGILTKQDVLDAAGQEPVSHSSVKRLVGGGFLDTLKSVVGKVAPIAKIGLALAPHPAAKAASAALGALGYGKSGGRKHSKLM